MARIDRESECHVSQSAGSRAAATVSCFNAPRGSVGSSFSPAALRSRARRPCVLAGSAAFSCASYRTASRCAPACVNGAACCCGDGGCCAPTWRVSAELHSRASANVANVRSIGNLMTTRWQMSSAGPHNITQCREQFQLPAQKICRQNRIIAPNCGRVSALPLSCERRRPLFTVSRKCAAYSAACDWRGVNDKTSGARSTGFKIVRRRRSRRFSSTTSPLDRSQSLRLPRPEGRLPDRPAWRAGTDRPASARRCPTDG